MNATNVPRDSSPDNIMAPPNLRTKAKATREARPAMGSISPDTFASRMFARTLCHAESTNLAISWLSCAYAFTTLIPEIFSWTLSVSSEKTSWTLRCLWLTALLNRAVPTARSGKGIRLIAASLSGTLLNRTNSVDVVMNTASMKSMIPCPRACLIAGMSFVAWAIRSPVLW
ncbi:MAG: hypothetical protein BWY85_01699 [Firmicutes bacterium ADurb.Bin506]|nr:MAG: hypothetical protein BWY85_01699 [Firmicutes bacterium ADurb.Bin506]